MVTMLDIRCLRRSDLNAGVIDSYKSYSVLLVEICSSIGGCIAFCTTECVQYAEQEMKIRGILPMGAGGRNGVNVM